LRLGFTEDNMLYIACKRSGKKLSMFETVYLNNFCENCVNSPIGNKYPNEIRQNKRWMFKLLKNYFHD
jgi:hypothetical protein